MAEKVRPALIVSAGFGDLDRALINSRAAYNLSARFSIRSCSSFTIPKGRRVSCSERFHVSDRSGNPQAWPTKEGTNGDSRCGPFAVARILLPIAAGLRHAACICIHSDIRDCLGLEPGYCPSAKDAAVVKGCFAMAGTSPSSSPAKSRILPPKPLRTRLRNAPKCESVHLHRH